MNQSIYRFALRSLIILWTHTPDPLPDGAYHRAKHPGCIITIMTIIKEEVLASSAWISDDLRLRCTSCNKEFHDIFNRRHHCRLCGDVFCKKCTQQRALIPPSSIVLQPKGGKKVSTQQKAAQSLAFQQDDDPDRRLTYKRIGTKSEEQTRLPFSSSENIQQESSKAALEQHEDIQINNQGILEDDLLSLSVASSTGISYGTATDSIANSHRRHRGNSLLTIDDDDDATEEGEVILYGKGLEQRMKLARDPLRVCLSCHDKLHHLQEELRSSNSNAVRFNSIDPTHIRRLLNSPVAFTLGHEIRKAAYTLNNLLPLPKRMGSFVSVNEDHFMFEGDRCSDICGRGSSDGVRIPVKLLEMAKGVAVMTVIKAGIGLAGFEFGTGLVVSRVGNDQWSPPCAIGSASASVGALAGAQITDHVFLLMTDEAVDIMSANEGSVQLGADIGVAVGPVGRSAEVDMGIGPKARDENNSQGPVGKGMTMAPIYTYSQSKGLYAGISLDGKIVVTRHEVNEKFYGCPVSSRELLDGTIPTPLAAQPLYDALKRCSVYAVVSKRSRAV